VAKDTAVLIFLALVECGCRGTPRDGRLLSLERTACYGPCPVYSVTLYNDGRVVYRGTSFVKTVGAATAQAEPSSIATLRRELRRSGVMSLGDHCCDCYDITDHPGAKISYDFGFGERGEVDHYHGCMGAPTWLGSFEDRIDAILETERFIGGPVERYKLFHAMP
jgi:hypothetical protein